MTPEQSVDLLFAEPFEPLWMRRQREDAEGAVSSNIDVQWNNSAERSRMRIVGRCKGAKYHNPPDTRVAVEPLNKRRGLML